MRTYKLSLRQRERIEIAGCKPPSCTTRTHCTCPMQIAAEKEHSSGHAQSPVATHGRGFPMPSSRPHPAFPHRPSVGSSWHLQGSDTSNHTPKMPDLQSYPHHPPSSHTHQERQWPCRGDTWRKRKTTLRTFLLGGQKNTPPLSTQSTGSSSTLKLLGGLIRRLPN